MSARKLRHSGRDQRHCVVYFIKLLNVASPSSLIADSAGFFHWSLVDTHTLRIIPTSVPLALLQTENFSFRTSSQFEVWYGSVAYKGA